MPLRVLESNAIYRARGVYVYCYPSTFKARRMQKEMRQRGIGPLIMHAYEIPRHVYKGPCIWVLIK